MKCSGCGKESLLSYGLCQTCRFMHPHQRPLNRPKAKEPKKVKPLPYSPDLDPKYIEGWNDAVREME